jgi:hypothetical protein
MKFCLIALTTLLLTGCFTSGPSATDFESAVYKKFGPLSADITAKATINAQEGNGSEVSPLYESRVSIDVIFNSDHYKVAGRPIQGTTIVEKVISKGTGFNLSGISETKLENEIWIPDLSKLKYNGEKFKNGKALSHWDNYAISGTEKAKKLISEHRMALKAKRAKEIAKLKAKALEDRKFFTGTWKTTSYKVLGNKKKYNLKITIPKGTALTGVANIYFDKPSYGKLKAFTYTGKFTVENGQLIVEENGTTKNVRGQIERNNKYAFNKSDSGDNKLFGYNWKYPNQKNVNGRHYHMLLLTK